MGGIWVPWRAGSATHQAAQRRTKGRMSGQVAGKTAINNARKAHRKKALKALKAGKLTPKQYQQKLREIG